jgi:hypothetical protein
MTFGDDLELIIVLATFGNHLGPDGFPVNDDLRNEIQ